MLDIMFRPKKAQDAEADDNTADNTELKKLGGKQR